MTGFVGDIVAERLGGASFGGGRTEYKFERIKRAKAEAALARPDVPIIDLGIGESDEAADPLVVGTLASEAGKRENRSYADNGTREFSEAAARYLDRVYDVRVDAGNIVHGIGSKQILALLPACFINPGDVLLVPSPAYPVAASWTRYLGGEVHALPLRRENGFLPDLSEVPPRVLRRAKLLYLNYPNNPTGAAATPEFFREVVRFAERNRILVIHDAAYGALTYGSNRPLSFLSTPGADEVGVEVHSLSKAFNMTGWRMGFVTGNRTAVSAYASIKENTDAGQFRAIQKAAITALSHPEITERSRERYSRRLDLLVGALRDAGFDAAKPAGTFYCYARAPVAAGNVPFGNAEEAALWLLTTAYVSTVPWDDAGSYLRFSATFEGADEAAEIAVMESLRERLLDARLAFG